MARKHTKERLIGTCRMGMREECQLTSPPLSGSRPAAPVCSSFKASRLTHSGSQRPCDTSTTNMGVVFFYLCSAGSAGIDLGLMVNYVTKLKLL